MKHFFFVVFINLLIVSISPVFSQNNETVYTTVEKLKEKKSEKLKFKDHVFQQYELFAPFGVNPNLGEKNSDGSTDKTWFIPYGLCARAGIGLQPEESWIAISAHTGIDWNIAAKKVAVPIYVNLRLAVYITDETKIVLQSGLGKGIGLGRGNLIGNFQKYCLGIEDGKNFGYFIEFSKYTFPSNPEHTFGNLGIGISYRSKN